MTKESFKRAIKQPEKKYNIRYTDRVFKYDYKLNKWVSA